ncbi:MAG: YcgN family cysteine cluster protein [Anaerolineae bacterium]|nr:YcgN family cysteine cluster protein [Anaerolineae bacterium]
MFPEEFAHPKFWQETSLKYLTLEQWESLCDGCARCCLYKIQDIDTDELFYTNVACRFLEAETCRCTDYIHRHDIMPTCIILTPRNLAEIDWMPETCAYRLLNEGKPLRWWHPLNSHGPDSVRAAGISICGKYLPEEQADMDHLENYIVEDLQ